MQKTITLTEAEVLYILHYLNEYILVDPKIADICNILALHFTALCQLGRGQHDL